MDNDRIKRLGEFLRAEQLAGALVCPSQELLFLTGFSPMMCERFQGMFVTADGGCFYVCNLLYAGEISSEYGEGMKVYSWMDGESMTDVVTAALRENGLLGGILAVNSSAQAFNVLDIARDCGVTFVNGLSVLEETRIIKSAEEIGNLQQAAKIADDTFEKVLPLIRAGQKEEDILHILTQSMVDMGGTHPWGIVASGPNSSYPHYLGTDRVVQEKDLMILDFGCSYRGMCSDISRTVFVGEIDPEHKKIYDIVLRANQAGEQAAVEGAFVPDVDEAARSIIRQEGYGETFINRLGHGIGYMGHEAPDIKKSNRRNLKRGMAFSIEPGIYIAGRFGMRIEDIVVITQGGNQVLNKASKEIIVL